MGIRLNWEPTGEGVIKCLRGNHGTITYTLDQLQNLRPLWAMDDEGDYNLEELDIAVELEKQYGTSNSR